MQALQVEILKDELNDQIEHFQPYGFTSAPLEYMDALVHFLSGDRSHGIVSVVADRTSRPLTLGEGDVAIYHSSDTQLTTAVNSIEAIKHYPTCKCAALPSESTSSLTLVEKALAEAAKSDLGEALGIGSTAFPAKRMCGA